MIYLDNAATTATAPEVINAMLPFYEERYGNPSAIYELGEKSKHAMDEVRQTIAKSIGAKPQEIFFTAGGSEADNWAIKTVAENLSFKGNHIITSRIEHHAVLRTCEYLAKNGYEITYITPDENGFIHPEHVRAAIRSNTVLISIMTANNEIGTIQPIAQIGALARRYGIRFHTDAVQAYGQIPIDVNTCHIDMLSASAHKFHGPKGVGFLYVREGRFVRSFIHGGSQEQKSRAGTENVPGIVGMGKAAELAIASMNERMERESRLREQLIHTILKEVPMSRLNGDRRRRLPNNADFCFPYIEGSNLLLLLDEDGICASTGSACAMGDAEPSHVLTAIGVEEELARGSLRLTLGGDTTKEEVEYVAQKVKERVAQLREKSSAYLEYHKNTLDDRKIIKYTN